MWGVEETTEPDKWTEVFARIKKDGFTCVEMIPPQATLPGMTTALKEAGLDLIICAHTTAAFESLETYKYMTAYSVQDHLNSLK